MHEFYSLVFKILLCSIFLLYIISTALFFKPFDEESQYQFIMKNKIWEEIQNIEAGEDFMIIVNKFVIDDGAKINEYVM